MKHGNLFHNLANILNLYRNYVDILKFIHIKMPTSVFIKNINTRFVEAFPLFTIIYQKMTLK